MLWAIIGIGALIVVALAVIVWAAFAIAGRADDQLEDWLNSRENEPRNEITGQPLTARERFERESG